MGERVTPTCDFDGCGKDIVPNLELGDRQGQPVEVRFAAYTQRMKLCQEHLKLLDALPYLPRG